jgi:hypothetical protein
MLAYAMERRMTLERETTEGSKEKKNEKWMKNKQRKDVEVQA